MSDPLIIAGREFHSRLFLGTAGYPNRQVMLDAVVASGTEMVTASIRRIRSASSIPSSACMVSRLTLEPVSGLPSCTRAWA